MALYDSASLLVSRISFISRGEKILFNENTINVINTRIKNIPVINAFKLLVVLLHWAKRCIQGEKLKLNKTMGNNISKLNVSCSIGFMVLGMLGWE